MLSSINIKYILDLEKTLLKTLFPPVFENNSTNPICIDDMFSYYLISVAFKSFFKWALNISRVKCRASL